LRAAEHSAARGVSVHAVAAYERMLSGKVRFRAVLRVA
jgi:hypothetical protein